MAVQENNSSVFDTDALNSSSKQAGTKVGPVSAAKPRARSRQASASDCKKRISELNEAHRKQIQALRSKYQADERALRQELKELGKKSRESIKDAADGSKKFYENQLKQMRSDYLNQNAILGKELKQFLEDSVSEIAKNQETKTTKESDERLDRLKDMIHEDFVEALQKKSEEIEQTRAESESRIAEVDRESAEKSHRISQLESKMKEISRYLPGDVQEEVYEQFGFQDELAALEEDPQPKRKGLLGRLTSVL